MVLIVIKIGGSLIGNARELVRLIHEYALETGVRILIVPGGGVFADTVRTAGDTYTISDEAAHWMAILAMDQYAHYLADGTNLELVSEIEPAHSTHPIPIGASILLSYDLLKRPDVGLVHTWNTTSDTIAGWIAARLCARFIKATDVDGIFRDGELLSETTARELLLMGETCVDAELPRLLISESLNCCIVNGNRPDFVIDAIRGVCGGTVVIGAEP